MTLKKALFLVLLWPLCFSSAVIKADEAQSDVRIVIDMSGSMKFNDPANLRAPALRMLVGLMPEQSLSGVWTFAKLVNMLVPWKPVSDDWRQHAIEQSEKIHSLGLYTDIEQALSKATVNINTTGNARRSVILLSDGFVDLPSGQAATAASRQRMLDTLIPRLKKAGITVHTIALSDQADHPLLKQLATGTDGWYEQADSAEELQRIFLRMFEKATQRDTVPLTDNQFVIDDSVKEMTVLAFRQQDADVTQMIQPDGKALSQDNKPEAVKWQHDAGFDLITISQPAVGQWQIDAALDPDNRVMVVTDMQMETTSLPNNVLAGENFELEARLTEKGEPIRRVAFLDLVDAELARERDGEIKQESFVRHSDEAVYKATLGDALKPGNNEIIVTMHSATFERQRRQMINVVASPLNINVAPVDGEARSHRIDVVADPLFLAPDSLTVTALLRDEAGSEWPYTLLKTDDNHWRLTLTDLKPEQRYELSIQAKGITPEGRAVFIQPASLPIFEHQIASSTSENDTALPEIELLPDMADIPVEPVDDVEVMQKQHKPLSDTDILLIGNALILLLLIIGIVWWRKQRRVATHLAGELG